LIALIINARPLGAGPDEPKSAWLDID